MTEAELLQQIAVGEHSRQQFKRIVNHPDALAAELVAFSNSGGGTLFIGINDDGSDDDPYGESKPEKVLAWMRENPYRG